MSLVNVVHRIATDSAFAIKLEQDPGASLIANDVILDPETIEAITVVLRGPRSWRDLCSLSRTDTLGGWWDARPSAAPHAFMSLYDGTPQSAYHQALRAAVGPEPSTAPTTMSDAVSLTTLPLLCYEAISGRRHDSHVVADAWNILYTALRLLDHIEDGDTPDQVWARWGTGPTLNITTGLIVSANMVLDTLEERGVTPQSARAIRSDFNRALLAMCAGQHDDLTCLEPTLEQCWEIAAAKTGQFFALAMRAGARLAASDDQLIEQCGAIGQHLGMLIQIKDDISGLWSWEQDGSDLRAGRWTLPVAYAMSVLKPEDRERLRANLVAAATDAAAEATARALIIQSGAVLYLTAAAQRHYHEATRLVLRAASSSSARDALLLLLSQSAPATITCDRIDASTSTDQAAVHTPAAPLACSQSIAVLAA